MQIDVSGDPLRDLFGHSGPFYVTGERWTLHMPYSGDADVFGFRPSQAFMTHVFASLRGSEVLVSFEFPDGREVDVEAETFAKMNICQARSLPLWRGGEPRLPAVENASPD